MTQTSGESEANSHDWHMIDDLAKVECRRISVDTYQLRSPTHEITINQEGFDLYRESGKEFEKWLDENVVESYPREPGDG